MSSFPSYPMRRIHQELPEDEARELLAANKTGVLSVIDENGLPYGVPLMYVVIDGTVYFHGALEGRKFAAIKTHDQASFCVIAENIIHPDLITTYYKSVICAGRLRVVTDPEERHKVMMATAGRCNPDTSADETYVDAHIGKIQVIALDIEDIKAKEAKGLVGQHVPADADTPAAIQPNQMQPKVE